MEGTAAPSVIPTEPQTSKYVMQQLAELVGKNLNQLAGLGGLTFQHYEALVLPGITEQIVHCEDKLAQRFLMEVCPHTASA